MSDHNYDDLQQIIDKSREARNGEFRLLSTGEQIAAALVLNRPDLLAHTGFTLAEAIDRLGVAWLALIPTAERVLRAEARSQ